MRQPGHPHDHDTRVTTTVAVQTTSTTVDPSGWLGTTEGPSTTAHTPPKYGDTISAWDIEITVSGPVFYENDSTTLFVGEDKEVWVLIGNIRNTGSKDYKYSLTCWEGRDQDNRLYRASVRFPDAALTNGTVPPGGIVTGYVGFELPKGSTLASVTYEPIAHGLEPERVTWEE